jgi:hypothetical protein
VHLAEDLHGPGSGHHTVRVVAIDRAGNTDATPAVQGFTL